MPIDIADGLAFDMAVFLGEWCPLPASTVAEALFNLTIDVSTHGLLPTKIEEPHFSPRPIGSV
jgi:hypothetical protein